VASELAPTLLVALNVIVDPNFRRTVVLMLEHEEDQGAVGLVLNRSTDFPLQQLCESLELPWRGAEDARVDWGGPVQEDSGWVLLGDEAASGLTDVEPLLPGVHWSRSQDALRRVGERPSLRARVFLGYAGWGAGQLEREIAEGSWLVVPATAALVFEPDLGRMWEAAVRSLGIDPAMLVSSQGVS
jgi:putative transcriptional regulator